MKNVIWKLIDADSFMPVRSDVKKEKPKKPKPLNIPEPTFNSLYSEHQ